jgi:hypothetical protein
MSRFSEYCQFRRALETARSNASLTVDQRRLYRDVLYQRFLESSSISSTDVIAAAFPPCLLRVHALGRRYDSERTTDTRTAVEGRVT